MATATFAAGCFWGVEQRFSRLDGVTGTEVGYTGGTTADPTYEQVCSHTTGHAEAVRVTYDPAAVSYEELLAAFFGMHDPTQLDRQGPDVGDQYRSEIFFHTPEQEKAARLGARLVTPVDAEYPKRLLQIYDPPLALYVQGEIQSRDERGVAIVGSRRTTHYGREVAERLAMQLAQDGVTVLSGLARGIDTAAHSGALKGKGRTLAVLGGGLDCLFPPENAELAAAIARQGAVVTEYPIGREPDKTTFPVRNRIVSGISMGVVVVEADVTSGAMITARQALEQGRTVFAVPGRVDSFGSRGPHQLIKAMPSNLLTLPTSINVIIPPARLETHLSETIF